MLESELEPGTSLTGMRDVYFEHLHPNLPMIELMRDLRDRGLRMAMLTNNVREWEPQWRAKLPDIDEIFEVVVDSAFVGMRKPDPEIYELTLERLGGDIQAERVRVRRRRGRQLRRGALARDGGGALREPEQAIAEVGGVTLEAPPKIETRPVALFEMRSHWTGVRWSRGGSFIS